MMRWVCRLAIASAVSGCSSPDVIQPGFRPSSMTTPGVVKAMPVTLVADNQSFHIGGRPFLFRSGRVDKLSFGASSIRVPQQDLFGNMLLQVAVSYSAYPVVHLGDALDISCRDEWERYAKAMGTPFGAFAGEPGAVKPEAKAGREWFFTPGNHDGYFFGNFIKPEAQWRDACSPSARMRKDEVIAAYLGELRRRYPEIADGTTGAWTGAANGERRLRHISWAHAADEFWGSWILQEIDISADVEASMILVDTSTYERPPRISATEKSLRLAAGETAALGADQLARLSRLARDAHRAGRVVILAGHHPFAAFDEPARRAVAELIGDGVVQTYISAHTHWGQYFAHPINGRAWLEPNLGSVLDYNAEWATLEVGKLKERVIVHMGRRRAESITTGSAGAELGIDCKNPDWLASPGDPDFYSNYKATGSWKPEAVDLIYYSTMLAALDRYRRCVPEDGVAPGVDLRKGCMPAGTTPASRRIREALAGGDLTGIRALVLALIDEDGPRRDPDNRRRQIAYQTCQALWGSHYEQRSFIVPVRDEETFEVGGVE